MIKNAIVPTPDDLAPLVAQALADTEPPVFIKRYIDNLAAILRDRPKTFRGYGMYWWAMKELLIEHGYTEFGENIELGTVSVFKFDDPVLTCCAAWAFYNYNVENGSMYSSQHPCATIDDPDYIYDLVDMDVEALAINASR